MAMQIKGVTAVLLDIEGTVCPIHFVKDVLFPYALTSLKANIENLWVVSSFQPYLNAFPASVRTEPSIFLAYIQSLMSKDSKDPNLKNLQGFLWLNGYESGALRCPLFPDVAPTLRKWHMAGFSILIYSSGSVAAQKLLFQYTLDGDLRPLFGGYFDTQNAGPKTESQSYTNIVAQSRIKGETTETREWLFISDRVAEVDAAVVAGMKALVIEREGNAPLDALERARNAVIQNLTEVEILG